MTVVSGVCTCPTSYTSAKDGDTCIKDSDKEEIGTAWFASIPQQKYYSFADSTTKEIVSGIFSYFYVFDVVGCGKYNDPHSCSSLANLCVL